MALGTAAVPMPEVNIGSAFSAAADAALNTTLSPPFTPYLTQDNDLVFLHGAQENLPTAPSRSKLGLAGRLSAMLVGPSFIRLRPAYVMPTRSACL